MISRKSESSKSCLVLRGYFNQSEERILPYKETNTNKFICFVGPMKYLLIIERQLFCVVYIQAKMKCGASFLRGGTTFWKMVLPNF